MRFDLSSIGARYPPPQLAVTGPQRQRHFTLSPGRDPSRLTSHHHAQPRPHRPHRHVVACSPAWYLVSTPPTPPRLATPGRTQGPARTTQLMHEGVPSRHTPLEPSHGPIEPQRAAPDHRSIKQKVCDGNCPHVDIVPPLPPHSQQLPHHRQPHRTNLHASPPPGRPRCRP